MDKDVFLAFFSTVERLAGRINSKRLLVLFFYLTWLYFVKDAPELILYLGSAAFLLVEWMLFRNGGSDALSLINAAKSAGEAMTTLLVVGLLLGASSAQASKGHFFNPSTAEMKAHGRAIDAQQQDYLDAKEECAELGTMGACAEAWDAALWPVQRAWLLNNRAVQVLGHSSSGIKELEKAEDQLLEALALCSQEEVITGGEGGSKACFWKAHLNLLAVRERIEQLEDRAKRRRK